MPRHGKRPFLPYAAIIAPFALVACMAHPAQRQTTSDSAATLAVVDQFHAALRAGDSAGAAALLGSDVIVLESGDVEDRTAYVAHHLPADIEFAKAVTEQRDPVHITVRGDVAWAASTGRARGQFRGRDVNSVSAELMVLVRTPLGWRISAIHWSSHRVSP
jgi:ketosteroid isomerase-like protein